MKNLVTLIAVLSITACGTMNSSVQAQDKAAEVNEAIQMAEAELAAAAKTGHVWRLIDPATGSKSQNLGKILEAAKEKQAAGELDEALRIANRVAETAKLGQQQAEQQADAEPFYNQ
ncbi:MAG: hypothetical protein OER96_07065 [Gammaproteobacteria bacterium]|nr:hypothetical protein [Gammaproteobacteria bacterium]